MIATARRCALFNRTVAGTLPTVLFQFLLIPAPVLAGAYFEDGYLGLTRQELHAKLGPPYAVREAKSALRMFRYYPLEDWERYFKLFSRPESGEDVYRYERGGQTVRYSFGYVRDPAEQSDQPTLYVRLVDIEFAEPVPLEEVPALVPEFQPPSDAAAPAFRSNLMVLLFKGPPNPLARFLVRGPEQDRRNDWTLAFQLFSLDGIPERFTPRQPIDRLEISVQSLEFVRARQRSTHEPVLNPFSPEFARQPPPPPSPLKRVPVPQYND